MTLARHAAASAADHLTLVEDDHEGQVDLTEHFRPAAASNLLLWVIGGVLVAALIWAWLTVLDRTVRAPGKVAPSAELQVVSNLEGGIVDAIFVKVGQVVRAGQPLLRLDTVESASAFGASSATLTELAAKIARLQAEVDGRAPQFPVVTTLDGQREIASERELYASRRKSLATLIAVSDARTQQALHAQAEALSSAGARRSAAAASASALAMLTPLVDEGLEPRMSLVQQQSQASVAASEAAAAAAAVARSSAMVAEARAAAAQVRDDWRARAADDLAAARADYAARVQAQPALASRVGRAVVRAPLDGVVNRVLVTTVGGSIRPTDPLVELVPVHGGLVIEALVTPQDIGRVRLGQRARVEVSAYESSVYGALIGRVQSISPDATVNERTGEAHYVVRVVTTSPPLRDRNGTPLPIGAGMSATVSLIGDRRSVLEYILTPFTRLSETAFRE